MNMINKTLVTAFLCGAVGGLCGAAGGIITFNMLEKKLRENLWNINSHLDRINENLEDCLNNINDHLWEIKRHIKNFENKECVGNEENENKQ